MCTVMTFGTGPGISHSRLESAHRPVYTSCCMATVNNGARKDFRNMEHIFELLFANIIYMLHYLTLKKKDKQCRQIRHADVNLQLLKYELCKTKCRVMKSFFSHKHKLKISALIEMLASFSFVQIEHGKYKYRTAVISGGCSLWL